MRILVVDDDRAVREALRRSLQFNGYTVELAEDGQQALDAVARQRPDAMVLDTMMPRVDGVEVCRRLRGAGDNLSVLMLTARDAVSDRVAGLDAGADDYLSKPFLLEELLARLRALLRRSSFGRTGGPGALTFADSDPPVHEVDSCSSPIEASVGHAKRATSSRSALRRVGRKLRLTPQGISHAAVIVAIIGLIPPFFGIFWSPDASDSRIIRSNTVDCIPFHGSRAAIGHGSFLNSLPEVVAGVRVRVETAQVAGQGYTYWLVLSLILDDGSVYSDRRQIEEIPDVETFSLDFLPNVQGRILMVELGVVAAEELRENNSHLPDGGGDRNHQGFSARTEAVSVMCRVETAR